MTSPLPIGNLTQCFDGSLCLAGHLLTAGVRLLVQLGDDAERYHHTGQRRPRHDLGPLDPVGRLVVHEGVGVVDQDLVSWTRCERQEAVELLLRLGQSSVLGLDLLVDDGRVAVLR